MLISHQCSETKTRNSDMSTNILSNIRYPHLFCNPLSLLLSCEHFLSHRMNHSTFPSPSYTLFTQHLPTSKPG